MVVLHAGTPRLNVHTFRICIAAAAAAGAAAAAAAAYY